MNDDIADERSIVAVLDRLAWVLDERSWDDLEHVFTSDAEAYGSAAGGPAAIAATVRQYLGGCGPSQHLLGNYEIVVEGDTATARTKFRAAHQGAGDRSAATYEVLGYYHDTFTRASAGWRMTRREIDVRMQFGDPSVLQPG